MSLFGRAAAISGGIRLVHKTTRVGPRRSPRAGASDSRSHSRSHSRSRGNAHRGERRLDRRRPAGSSRATPAREAVRASPSPAPNRGTRASHSALRGSPSSVMETASASGPAPRGRGRLRRRGGARLGDGRLDSALPSISDGPTPRGSTARHRRSAAITSMDASSGVADHGDLRLGRRRLADPRVAGDRVGSRHGRRARARSACSVA